MTDTMGAEEELDPDAAMDEALVGLDLSAEEQAEATEMVQRLRSQYGLDETSDEAPEEPEAETASEPESAEELEEEPPPPPAPPDPFAGIPEDEKRSLLGLRNYLAANPDKAQEVQRVISGEQPPPEPVAIPEWIDQDDPAQMGMWNHLQSLEGQVQKTVKSQAQIAEAQVANQARTEIQEALTSYAAGHPELSGEDIDNIRRHAVALNIITGIHDSLGGPKTPGAGREAVLKALDMAYWDHPEYRAKALDKPTPSQAKLAVGKERKAKLAALGGSSGSTARTETRPDLSSDKAMREGAAQYLRDNGIL